MSDPTQPPFNEYQPPREPLTYTTPVYEGELPHSRIGIASFAIAVFAFFGSIMLVVIAGYIGAKAQGQIEDDNPFLVLVGLGFLAILGFAALGMLLGLVSLFFADRRRVFGVLGLLGNLLIVLGMCGLMLLGAATRGTI